MPADPAFILQTHENRITRVENAVSEMTTQIAQHGERIDTVGQRVDETRQALGEKLDRIDAKLDTNSEHGAQLAHRVEKLESGAARSSKRRKVAIGLFLGGLGVLVEEFAKFLFHHFTH